jgi:hypothetical protein
MQTLRGGESWLDTAHDSDAHRVIHAIEGGRLTGFIERPGRGADRKLVTDVGNPKAIGPIPPWPYGLSDPRGFDPALVAVAPRIVEE